MYFAASYISSVKKKKKSESTIDTEPEKLAVTVFYIPWENLDKAVGHRTRHSRYPERSPILEQL